MPELSTHRPFSTLQGGVETSGGRGDKTFSTTTPYRVGGGGGGGSLRGGGGEPRCLIPFDRREGLTTAQAAVVAGRTERRVRQWCVEHDLGRRVAGGPWLVSKVALDMFLNSDLKALRSYLAGDRRSETVVRYFEAAGLRDLPERWQNIPA
jgi:hypothetical protein